MHHIVTIQRYFPYQNLGRFWCWPFSNLFVTFWTRSWSNCSMLQLLVNMIMPQNLPASCCNFIGSGVLLIRISAKFDVDLCVIILNFQSNPKSNDLVKAINTQKLYLPCCSFTGIFSTSESRPRFMLNFMQPFWTFSVAQGQAAL